MVIVRALPVYALVLEPEIVTGNVKGPCSNLSQAADVPFPGFYAGLTIMIVLSYSGLAMERTPSEMWYKRIAQRS